MITSDPIPWSDVPTGATVLVNGVPRRVMVNRRWDDRRVVAVEGCGLSYPAATDAVRLVLLDDADAVANLRAAGLNPQPIGESS